jgi:hypothetical protein
MGFFMLHMLCRHAVRTCVVCCVHTSAFYYSNAGHLLGRVELMLQMCFFIVVCVVFVCCVRLFFMLCTLRPILNIFVA